MQHSLSNLQEVVFFLQIVACGRVIEREGGSKTAPFTLPLPGARAPIAAGFYFATGPF